MERQKVQVTDQQVPKRRCKLSDNRMTSIFHQNFNICLSSQNKPCVNLSSDFHAPKWNDGAQIARWLILQVLEWRHLALNDAMTSDFWKNHRDHFSYQYFACVNITSWLEHQKWSYCCFYFCIDYELCRNHMHSPKKHPPTTFKVSDRWSWKTHRMREIDKKSK